MEGLVSKLVQGGSPGAEGTSTSAPTKGHRSSQRRRECRAPGRPYRSSAAATPRERQLYLIRQLLPGSTREEVWPMRALQLAAVQIQRVAR